MSNKEEKSMSSAKTLKKKKPERRRVFPLPLFSPGIGDDEVHVILPGYPSVYAIVPHREKEVADDEDSTSKNH